jgi:hypothetical protein
VDSVRAEVRIARPRAAVFAFLADQRNRARLLPDNFTDVIVLTPGAGDVGARFIFTIHTDRGAYDSETELIANEPQSYLAERTTDSETTYETHWRLTEHENETLIIAETRYPRAGNLITRVFARTFGRRALQQSLLIELLRLKQAVEGREIRDEE